ncbi:hypothetical protein [Bradyrhizobium sp. ORS 375]|uniref:hypothetical protein n=1 Tax=Bradyrhizobium sp. (strain ORS 375) TaxID=566679 RepID=UPI000A05758E|nr:hypothetical protein [Bradyrhizobium sp. ORS 375]
MERYIRNENIRRFRQLLEAETDEQKRRILRQLLASEERREVPSETECPADGRPQGRINGSVPSS